MGPAVHQSDRRLSILRILRVAVVANDSLTRAGLVALLESERIAVPFSAGSQLTPEQLLGSGIDVVVWAWEESDEIPSPAPDSPVLLLLPSQVEPAELRLIADDEMPGTGYGEQERPWFDGAIDREAGATQLVAAVTAVAAGLVVFQPEFAQLFSPPSSESGGPDGARVGELPLEPLSTRELEVLWLLADGLSNKSIAQRLELSEHTVKFHLGSLFDKLAVHNRTEAVSLAIRLGLIAL